MILLQALTLEINGVVLLLIAMIVGGSVGWDMGVRALISTVLTSVIAFVIFVNGGQEALSLVNPFYTNLPAVIALFTGGNVGAAGDLAPIAIPFGLPLPARIIGFILFGPLLAWLLDRLNWPGWYKDKPDDKARSMGMFSGVLLAMLFTEAAVIFWQDFVAAGGSLGDNFFTTALSILPDMGLLPVIVGAVFIVLMLVFNLPKIWKA